MVVDRTAQANEFTKVIAPFEYPSFHAIPIPVDFVAGSLLTLAVIVVTTRRPWRPDCSKRGLDRFAENRKPTSLVSVRRLW